MKTFRDFIAEDGSYLDNQQVLKLGSEVWILTGQFADNPQKGMIKRIDNIDNKGLANTYVDVDVNGKIYHTNVAQVFDHKPKLVQVKDEYGFVKRWQ